MLYLIHILCFLAIVGVATWGIPSGAAGEVSSAIVIALAMQPFMIHYAARRGKTWSVWLMYASVALAAVGAVVTRAVGPTPVWLIGVPPLIYGGVLLMRRMIRSRAIR